MKGELLVIEPHADDAFLSTGSHISKWIGDGVKVYIATVSPQSEKRLREAARYAEALGATHLRLGEELTRKLRSRNVQRVIPLGIQHPEHMEVSGVYYARGAWAYLDQPYGLKLKNEEAVISKLEGLKIVSYLKPPAKKWKHVPIFQDQAKFFHFNKDTLPKIFELIVRLP